MSVFGIITWYCQNTHTTKFNPCYDCNEFMLLERVRTCTKHTDLYVNMEVMFLLHRISLNLRNWKNWTKVRRRRFPLSPWSSVTGRRRWKVMRRRFPLSPWSSVTGRRRWRSCSPSWLHKPWICLKCVLRFVVCLYDIIMWHYGATMNKW